MAVYPINPVIPDHVPAELVRDYDVYAPGPPTSDFHVELYRLKQQAPAIFWTRNTGGHWYVTDTVLVREMLTDPVRFSNARTTLPVSNASGPGFIPVSLDPPQHGFYRRPLSRAFSRPHVQKLEPDIRALAVELIDAIKAKGECEFVGAFAAKLPVVTFLRLFELPLDDRPWLLAEVGELMTPGSDKLAKLRSLSGYLSSFVSHRYAEPGDELISRLGLEQIDGERIGEGQLLNMCTLLLIGGLDSVANTVGFIARFLAQSPEHRRQIIETPAIVAAAVEELLRRFPTTAVGTGRLCIQDTSLGGVTIKAGDS